MWFLQQRHRQPELMDQPGLSDAEHGAALEGLRRVNLLSTSVSKIWSALRAWAPTDPQRPPLRVLDVACGGGDVAIRLATRARQQQIPMTIHGCDLSPTALQLAREASQRAGLPEMEFFVQDALRDPLPLDYDIIMCSLFLHHLDEVDALKLMQAMSTAARKAILIDDLQRTRWGYALCWVGCRILTRSKIVHTDGPLSVQGAFTVSEVQNLADQCGLPGARIQRHWPQRFLLSWERP